MGRVVSEPVLGSSLSQEVEELTSSSSDLNGRHRRVALGVGRLSCRWYSCPEGRPWVRCKTGVSQVARGVVLGEPGFV